MKLPTRGAIALAVAAALSLSGAALGAQAAPNDSTSTTTVSYAPECLDKIADIPGASQDICKITTTTVLSAPEKATASTLAADKSLTASERTTLAAAGVTGKHWTQFTFGYEYTTTQDGTFYYNGSRAWVKQTYAGYTGTQYCRANYQIGVVIKKGACSDTGGTASRNLYYGWQVTVTVNGVPIGYDYSMSATVKSNGTISGTNASVG